MSKYSVGAFLLVIGAAMSACGFGLSMNVAEHVSVYSGMTCVVVSFIMMSVGMLTAHEGFSVIRGHS